MLKYSTLILIIIIFISCKNEKEIITNKKEEFESVLRDTIILNMPQEIFIGDTLRAKAMIRLTLDSIKLSEKDLRYTLFYIATDSLEISDIEEIKTKKHGIFIERKKGEIEFNYQFNRTGLNYLTGIIEDEVHLDNYYGDGKTRVITHWIKIVKEVYVKPKIIKSDKL